MGHHCGWCFIKWTKDWIHQCKGAEAEKAAQEKCSAYRRADSGSGSGRGQISPEAGCAPAGAVYRPLYQQRRGLCRKPPSHPFPLLAWPQPLLRWGLWGGRQPVTEPAHLLQRPPSWGNGGKPPWEFYSCTETMNSLLSPYPEDFLNSDISLFARALHLFCAAPRKRKYCTPRENQLEAFWKVISLMVDILEKNKPSKKHCRDCVMGKGSPHAEHKFLSFTTLLYISHACHYQILPISFTSFFLLGRKKR